MFNSCYTLLFVHIGDLASQIAYAKMKKRNCKCRSILLKVSTLCEVESLRLVLYRVTAVVTYKENLGLQSAIHCVSKKHSEVGKFINLEFQ